MFPSGSRIDRVEVKPVPRRPGGRRFGLGLRGADVVEAVPFPAHEARLHVDLLDRRVDDRPAPRSFDRHEVAADRVVRGDVGDVVGGDLEVVQVRLQAVSAGDPRDRAVAGVHDDVFALTEAQRQHAPLPPGQVALPFIGLLVEVLRGFAARQPVEPHELALRRVDQRPVLTRTGPVGREHVARRGVAIGHGDVQDRGLDAWQRVEALVVGGRSRRVGELRHARRRIRGVDAKAERDSLAAGPADRGLHAYLLAGVERLVQHEAAAVALGVPAYVAAVVAGLGADDRDFPDVRDVRAEEADLGVRVGGVGSRLGRDVDVGAGRARAVFERRRQTGGRGPIRRVRRARAEQAEAGRAAHDRGHGPSEDRDQQDDVPVAFHVRV